MDKFEAMRSLLAVVDAGSISGGSRRLNVPLPSVSRKMADLERHLGANLLIRTNRTLQLTNAGREYVTRARRIMAELEEAEKHAAGEYQRPRGTLKITMPQDFGSRYILPIALEFMKTYPEVSLELVSQDHTVDLVSDQVDLAIRLGELPDSSLRAIKIGEFRLLTCASPSYLDQKGVPLLPDDLSNHDGVMFNSRSFFWTFRLGDEVVEILPQARLEVNTAANCVAAALNGAGIARLFDYQVRKHLESGELVQVLEDFDNEVQPIHMVYPQQGLLPLKLRSFIDWALPRLRDACCPREIQNARLPDRQKKAARG